jgi:hypothetical protein
MPKVDASQTSSRGASTTREKVTKKTSDSAPSAEWHRPDADHARANTPLLPVRAPRGHNLVLMMFELPRNGDFQDELDFFVTWDPAPVIEFNVPVGQ